MGDDRGDGHAPDDAGTRRLEVFEAALRQMPIAVVIVEAPSGRPLLTNAELRRIWRAHARRPIDSFDDYVQFSGFHADGRRYEPHEWPVARALLAGDVTTAEDIVITRGDDTRTTVRVSASPIRDEGGRPIAAISTFYDVDEHGASERALRESEERHRLVGLATREFLWEVDLVRGRTLYSDALRTVFGHEDAALDLPFDEALAWWSSAVHPDDRARVIARSEAHLVTSEIEYTDEYRFRKGDGSYVLVSDRHCTVRSSDGAAVRVVGAITDLSQRNRADEARRKLAGIVEASDDAIYHASLDMTIQSWNPGAERIFGYSAEEAIGRSALMLARPERASELHHAKEILLRDGHAHIHTTRRVRKDGTDVEVSVSVAALRSETTGEPIEVAVVMRDMTEHRRLEARLAVADRMASLGILAASVGHEINNPLAYVSTNLELVEAHAQTLSGQPGDTGSVAKEILTLVAEARDGTARVGRIVRDLRTLARTNDGRTPLDLREVVDAAVRMAAGQVRHHARLVRDYGEVPTVEANEAHLVQLFLNLLINAAQAIPEGAADHNEIRVVLGADVDGRARIEVRDTGAGIPAELMPRIFEPLFTTKPSGGMGLGLAICQRIVAAEGGEITVESAVGVGSVFRVAIPAATGVSATRTLAPPPADGGPKRRARILVVDDEPRLGQAMHRFLSPHHDVRVVTSGAAALEALTAGARFDLILCDLMMPEMTGMALHEALARDHPGQADRMVFLTGGAFTPAARSFLEAAARPVLEKPFELTHLQQIVDGIVALP